MRLCLLIGRSRSLAANHTWFQKFGCFPTLSLVTCSCDPAADRRLCRYMSTAGDPPRCQWHTRGTRMCVCT
ncbi:hypothetical protein GGS23DRAFT_556760 [Durotheca rogersii]|uniref:uncharacterized protein n=1 Tax=Durotheca rogersii TaxID=419775 RepID=UPI00221F4E23|nr:uncharacterized protein GGS23DRAFT_556760 [Durotheca rogersii]KAI5866364.1 hypothetical protein GGS23DRAFT_556760 [Durotheca rogersii]